MNILQIKLEGETRLQSSKPGPDSSKIQDPNAKPIIKIKEIEHSTRFVDVQVKREIFEFKIEAKVIVESLSVASKPSSGTSGTTAYCEQHKWESLKGCALFGVLWESKNDFHICKLNMYRYKYMLTVIY